MRKIIHRIGFRIFISATILLMFSILIYSLVQESREEKTNHLYHVPFVGEYQIDDGEFQTFSDKNEFSIDKNYNYTFQGHFGCDIPVNEQVILRLTDLNIVLTINGEIIYQDGDSLKHSNGNRYVSFTSPGISKEDFVEIKLYNVYTRVHAESINEFFNKMYYGSYAEVFQQEIKGKGSVLLAGGIVLFIGVIAVIAGIFLIMRKVEEGSQLLKLGFLGFFSGIWLCIEFDVTPLIFGFPKTIEQVDVLSAYAMSAFFAVTLMDYTSGRRYYLVSLNVLISFTLILITIFTTAVLHIDAYQTIPYGWAMVVVNCGTLLIYLVWEYLIHKSMVMKKQLTALCIVLIGGALDSAGYFFSLWNESNWMRICFIIYLLLQLKNISLSIYEKSEKAKLVQQMENEMTQAKMDIMLSQIQPHFLYNSLTALSQLCDVDPKRAQKGLIDFSVYLRGNLDALKQRQLIPIEQELKHTKVYLNLEKMRFNEYLNIEYDIRTGDFLLPALTIQPIVENAVKHGLCPKEEGGTVKISIWEEAKEYLVEILDNGVGFDVEHNAENRKDDEEWNSRQHIGMENVKNRLKMQCGGTMDIVSQISKGTRVTVHIPKD